MYYLYATGYSDNQKIRAVRGFRAARALVADPDFSPNLRSTKAIADRLQDGSDAQLIVKSPDSELIERAKALLIENGVECHVLESLEGAAVAEVKPSNEAAKVALVLLAHTNGNVQLALGAAQAQAKVLSGDAADIQTEAAGILVDTFS